MQKIAIIKRLAIIALFSDDELMDSIVLKGGNAIDLLQKDTPNSFVRASYDLDFSITNGDFQNNDVSERIRKALSQTFTENGYTMFDYRFGEKPKEPNLELPEFWGGYKVEFKVLESSRYEELSGNIDKQRRNAISLNPDQSPKFIIEFSKHEHTGKKQEIRVDGHVVYVYTPEMIVFEKVRAICQQLPMYKAIVPSFSPRARARDFYDIKLLIEKYDIDISSPENVDLLSCIFQAKGVPLSYIKEIQNFKSIHKDNWESVLATIGTKEVGDFDQYFDFLTNLLSRVIVL